MRSPAAAPALLTCRPMPYAMYTAYSGSIAAERVSKAPPTLIADNYSFTVLSASALTSARACVIWFAAELLAARSASRLAVLLESPPSLPPAVTATVVTKPNRSSTTGMPEGGSAADPVTESLLSQELQAYISGKSRLRARLGKAAGGGADLIITLQQQGQGQGQPYDRELLQSLTAIITSGLQRWESSSSSSSYASTSGGATAATIDSMQQQQQHRLEQLSAHHESYVVGLRQIMMRRKACHAEIEQLIQLIQHRAARIRRSRTTTALNSDGSVGSVGGPDSGGGGGGSAASSSSMMDVHVVSDCDDASSSCESESESEREVQALGMATDRLHRNVLSQMHHANTYADTAIKEVLPPVIGARLVIASAAWLKQRQQQQQQQMLPQWNFGGGGTGSGAGAGAALASSSFSSSSPSSFWGGSLSGAADANANANANANAAGSNLDSDRVLSHTMNLALEAATAELCAQYSRAGATQQQQQQQSQPLRQQVKPQPQPLQQQVKSHQQHLDEEGGQEDQAGGFPFSFPFVAASTPPPGAAGSSLDMSMAMGFGGGGGMGMDQVTTDSDGSE